MRKTAEAEHQLKLAIRDVIARNPWVSVSALQRNLAERGFKTTNGRVARTPSGEMNWVAHTSGFTCRGFGLVVPTILSADRIRRDGRVAQPCEGEFRDGLPFGFEGRGFCLSPSLFPQLFYSQAMPLENTTEEGSHANRQN